MKMNKYRIFGWGLVILHIATTLIWGLWLNDIAKGYLYCRLIIPSLDLISTGGLFTLLFSTTLLTIEYFERKSGVKFNWYTISPLSIFLARIFHEP